MNFQPSSPRSPVGNAKGVLCFSLHLLLHPGLKHFGGRGRDEVGVSSWLPSGRESRPHQTARPKLHQAGYCGMKAVYKRQKPHYSFIAVLKCTDNCLGPLTHIMHHFHTTLIVLYPASCRCVVASNSCQCTLAPL